MGHLRHNASGHLTFGPNGHLVKCPACPTDCSACASGYAWSISGAVSPLIPTSGTVSRVGASDACLWNYVSDPFLDDGGTYYYEIVLRCTAEEWWLEINLYRDYGGGVVVPWGGWVFTRVASSGCPVGAYNGPDGLTGSVT